MKCSEFILKEQTIILAQKCVKVHNKKVLTTNFYVITVHKGKIKSRVHSGRAAFF